MFRHRCGVHRQLAVLHLEFQEDFVAELTAAFTEQAAVILAALAAEMNRNAPLFEALGAPPLDFGPQEA